MANSIIMPKTGMTMEEGIILEWRIKTGDSILKGDVIALIETDKATMELESDYSGTILAVLNQAGETVPVTKVIAWIGEAGEAVPEIVPAPLKNISAPAGAGTIAEVPAGGRIKATPAARALAKERGIDLHTIVPTGRYGEIRQSAVLAQPAGMIQKKTIFHGDVSLTNIQKITGRKMAENIHAVASYIKADVTYMLHLSREINNSLAVLNLPGKITINDFVLASAVNALLAYPRLNSVLEGYDLICKDSINIGMVTAAQHGFVVPVIHNAQDYSLLNLSLKAAELAAKAREGSLKPGEISGGTFTISNTGIFGITAFTPIINQPEVAILGVCAVEELLKKDGEKIVTRNIMELSLAFDYRIVDGAESSMFLNKIKTNLESPLLNMI